MVIAVRFQRAIRKYSHERKLKEHSCRCLGRIWDMRLVREPDLRKLPSVRTEKVTDHKDISSKDLEDVLRCMDQKIWK